MSKSKKQKEKEVKEIEKRAEDYAVSPRAIVHIPPSTLPKEQQAFCRAMVLFNGDTTRAYKAAFKVADFDFVNSEHIETMLSDPLIVREIDRIATAENKILSLIATNQALRAKTPKAIDWADKHKFMETEYERTGQTGGKSQRTNVNVGIQIT